VKLPAILPHTFSGSPTCLAASDAGMLWACIKAGVKKNANSIALLDKDMEAPEGPSRFEKWGRESARIGAIIVQMPFNYR
jgi:hypothetical protein